MQFGRNGWPIIEPFAFLQACPGSRSDTKGFEEAIGGCQDLVVGEELGETGGLQADLRIVARILRIEDIEQGSPSNIELAAIGQQQIVADLRLSTQGLGNAGLSPARFPSIEDIFLGLRYTLKACGAERLLTRAPGYAFELAQTRAGAIILAAEHEPLTALLAGTTLEQLTDSYEYDAFGELSRYTASFGATVLYDVEYDRDALGRITTKTETVQGTTVVYEYGYDNLGQLETVHEDTVLVSTYVYDDNGNRLSHTTPGGTTSGSYNDQDQLLSYGTLTFSGPCFDPASDTGAGRSGRGSRAHRAAAR